MLELVGPSSNRRQSVPIYWAGTLQDSHSRHIQATKSRYRSRIWIVLAPWKEQVSERVPEPAQVESVARVAVADLREDVVLAIALGGVFVESG